MDVYVESGSKKVFAVAVDWPGYCRSARSEDEALSMLIDYAARYRRVAGRAFVPPGRLRVVERVDGEANTDFGVPAVPPALDARPIDPAELKRQIGLLRKCWDAFDGAARAAGRTTLATGPRGGGRDVAKIRAHVFEGQGGYRRMVGGPALAVKDMAQMRTLFEESLHARARGELPDRGPRGGARWSARYGIRRSAWHALDHAWEIEDRAR